MEHYELLVIFPAKFTDAELKDVAAKLEKTITGLGAMAVATHMLGTRKLAYPIQQSKNGSYVMFNFERRRPACPR